MKMAVDAVGLEAIAMKGKRERTHNLGVQSFFKDERDLTLFNYNERVVIIREKVKI